MAGILQMLLGAGGGGTTPGGGSGGSQPQGANPFLTMLLGHLGSNAQFYQPQAQHPLQGSNFPYNFQQMAQSAQSQRTAAPAARSMNTPATNPQLQYLSNPADYNPGVANQPYDPSVPGSGVGTLNPFQAAAVLRQGGMRWQNDPNYVRPLQ